MVLFIICYFIRLMNSFFVTKLELKPSHPINSKQLFTVTDKVISLPSTNEPLSIDTEPPSEFTIVSS